MPTMKLGRRTVEPGRRRRRLSSGLTLALALGTVGVGYSFLAPSSSAEDSGLSVEAQAGQELFEVGCITCHGANLQGVDNRGPSLVGIGEAAVYFQVSTGRMPCVQNEAQCPVKDPIYTDAEVNQLMAYIQANGGGPTLPTGDLRDGDLAEGGELFRLNCASCHNFAGRGGALSAGKYAPSLAGSSDLVIYSAMLSGPQSMPVFGDNQLTPEQKRSVINYVQTLKESQDPGGLAIGRAGPVPEGLVIWIVGIAACIGAALWVGSRS
ncbi:MAG: c-type cytochrome [Geodermatophilaceae bacterium]|nr:c-type cytochrome [Geodermatophilaceae bacterium]